MLLFNFINRNVIHRSFNLSFSHLLLSHLPFRLLNTGLILSVSLAGLMATAAPVPEAINPQTTSPVTRPITTTATKPITKSITDADLIRVGISSNDMAKQEYPLTRITATSKYKLTDEATNKLIHSGSAGQAITVTKNSRGFYVLKPGYRNKTGPFKGPITLKPTSLKGLVKALNITRRRQNPKYKGYFEVTKAYSSPSKLSLINVVPLQEYLKAVVPNELPARYGYEAVKAQSVAARNYAIRPREKYWPQFDICDSQYCQVYFGSHTEHPSTNKGLAETHGLIALFQGNPILALFSSAHGGHSENYENSFSDPKNKQFPTTPLPYLSGRPDIDSPAIPDDLTVEENARKFWLNRNIPSYDVKSPYNRWEKRWSRAQIIGSLNKQLAKVSGDKMTASFISPAFKKGQTIGDFKRVNVLRRGVSGKAMVVEIIGSKGKWQIQKEFVIRKVLAHRGRMLPSANVVFSHMTGASNQLIYLKANGGGFGHGVGMSQLGASYLSGQGRPFSDIIQHYYRGVSIGSIPLQVGKTQMGKTKVDNQKNNADAVRTKFYTEKPEGVLLLATNQSGPVTISINGKTLTLQSEQPTETFRSSAQEPIGQYLKTKGLNTLVLYSDPKNPNRQVKAWVEIIPAVEKDLKAVLPINNLKQPQQGSQVCVLNVCW